MMLSFDRVPFQHIRIAEFYAQKEKRLYKVSLSYWANSCYNRDIR